MDRSPRRLAAAHGSQFDQAATILYAAPISCSPRLAVRSGCRHSHVTVLQVTVITALIELRHKAMASGRRV
jgi:hypothetical protein